MMNPTEQIWKEYHNQLNSFIESRVSDASIADDILQEVFARIYSHIGTLKESSKLQSWIYQITRNAIVDHFRARGKMEELPDSFSTPEIDPSDRTRQEIQAWFLPMIDSLPDHYRQALTLSEIEGMTQKEVARRLGLSLSGAKARVRRGRAMMKKMLLDCCRFEFDHQGSVIDWETKGRTCDGC